MRHPTDEESTERRLQHEAQTVRLGTLTTGEPVVNVAQVEVTYQWPGEIEHSGHLIVRMPADVDPWLVAREAAYDWLERKGELDYSMVDDIYAV